MARRKDGLPRAFAPVDRRGVRAVAMLELAKGVLALAAAGGLEVLGPSGLRAALGALIREFRLSSTDGPMAWLLRAIDQSSVHIVAAVAAAYGLLRLVEAWGLWRHRAWASWLGAVSAALYLPFDVYALGRHPGWAIAVVVLVNLAIVAVLVRDLRHRQRHPRHVA